MFTKPPVSVRRGVTRYDPPLFRVQRETMTVALGRYLPTTRASSTCPRRVIFCLDSNHA
jgi:hypothetical protein